MPASAIFVTRAAVPGLSRAPTIAIERGSMNRRSRAGSERPLARRASKTVVTFGPSGCSSSVVRANSNCSVGGRREVASSIRRRLLLAIPVLWAASLLVFIAIRLVPGEVLVGNVELGPIDEAVRQQIMKDLGLDVPAPLQYVRWLGGIVQGDFGRSPVRHHPGLPPLLHPTPLPAQPPRLAVIL